MLRNSQCRSHEQKLGADGSSPASPAVVAEPDGAALCPALRDALQPACPDPLPLFPAPFAACVRDPAVSHGWDSSAVKWFLLFFLSPPLPQVLSFFPKP